MMGWSSDMSEAPRDGDPVLLWNPFWENTTGWIRGEWDDYKGAWRVNDPDVGEDLLYDDPTSDEMAAPTHWFRPPETPSAD